MTKRHPDDPRPRWYRLSPEIWALIRDEYAAGATARELARKYRTSATSIYRYASLEGWTKQAVSDALARTTLQREAPPERQLADLIEALKHASSAPGRAPPPPPTIEADDPIAAAAALEQRALAQVGEALARGKASDAKALAAIADQMRKRLETANTTREVEEEAAQKSQQEAEEAICDLFVKVAYVANAMVHAPSQAPAAFQGLIKLWREQNLGEGEADADRVAAKIAKAQAAWIDGSFEETLPDYVRARMDADWAARREDLAKEPVIPRLWDVAPD